MAQWRVTWEIDVEAESLQDAVAEARASQTDSDTLATCFTAENTDTGERYFVDLGYDEQRMLMRDLATGEDSYLAL